MVIEAAGWLSRRPRVEIVEAHGSGQSVPHSQREARPRFSRRRGQPNSVRDLAPARAMHSSTSSSSHTSCRKCSPSAEHIVVLRTGRVVATCAAAAVTSVELAELMIDARALRDVRERAQLKSGEWCRLVRGQPGSRQPSTARRPLKVAGGEIFGIARHCRQRSAANLCNILFGLAAPLGGARRSRRQGPARDPRLTAGIRRWHRIPQDRGAMRINSNLSVWENAISERRRSPAFLQTAFCAVDKAQVLARRSPSMTSMCSCRDKAMYISQRHVQKLILGRALFGEPSG